MKRKFRIVMIIFIILTLISCVGYRILNGPRVKKEDKIEITKYVENYLTKKYGEHKFKVTSIRYEYHSSTFQEAFAHSNPVGYWVDFKSDVAKDSWVVIDGLKSDDYKVKSDYFIESYYFPNQNVYDISNIMDNMEPKKEFEAELLNELQNEFEPNVYEVKCEYIELNIPEDYGKIPTLEELKTNTNLYTTRSFDYKVLNTIEDENEYEKKLKVYITSKYKCDSDIFFNQKNTLINVYLKI